MSCLCHFCISYENLENVLHICEQSGFEAGSFCLHRVGPIRGPYKVTTGQILPNADDNLMLRQQVFCLLQKSFDNIHWN